MRVTMRGKVRKLAAALTCAVLAAATWGLVGGCGKHTNVQRGALVAIVSPAIPATVQEVTNPLRGQYEDLLQSLFPQGNPADKRYPAWPKTQDASVRLSWRELQPTDPRTLATDAPDDQKYDFHVIDEALAQTADRGARLMLQVFSYNSCCNASYPNNTNIEIPDWVRALPGSSTSYPGPPTGSAAPRITQVVPNWNDPNYLAGFEQLLAALGRRYDRDERLSVFEFSGYGDFSENHISYMRDVLGAPGPAQQDSPKTLGYYVVFRDQTINLESIRRLVAAHASAFPHTQMDVTSNNPEIMREMLVDPNITTKLDTPVGIRTNALGFYSPMPAWATTPASQYVIQKSPLISEVRKRFETAPVITEWADLTSGRERDLQSYYEQAMRDVVKYHVSMTSSVNFPDSGSTAPMDPKLYLQWAQTNVIAGYRYSVEARAGSESVSDGAATIATSWTNYGSAAAFEKWVPGYRLIDFSGSEVRTLPSHVVLKNLVHEESADSSDSQPVPVSTDETVRINLAGLPPGHYTLQASVVWQQHKPGGTHVVQYPPMQLARDGRDSSGWYPIATLDIPRSELKASSPQ
jgi:hypothetical protein